MEGKKLNPKTAGAGWLAPRTVACAFSVCEWVNEP